jgi:hypothetical protein
VALPCSSITCFLAKPACLVQPVDVRRDHRLRPPGRHQRAAGVVAGDLRLRLAHHRVGGELPPPGLAPRRASERTYSSNRQSRFILVQMPPGERKSGNAGRLVAQMPAPVEQRHRPGAAQQAGEVRRSRCRVPSGRASIAR